MLHSGHQLALEFPCPLGPPIHYVQLISTNFQERTEVQSSIRGAHNFPEWTERLTDRLTMPMGISTKLLYLEVLSALFYLVHSNET